MSDFPENFPDGTLMVRDNGPGASPNVEFWFYAANQNIDYGYVQFEKRVNDVTTVFSIALRPHMGWIQVSIDNAILSQYVTWQLDTNLSGTAGYPYILNVHIYRPSVPDPPSQPFLSNITVNSIDVGWYDGYNGGATILGYQLGYGQDSSGPTTIINANPIVRVGNLPTGVVSYFWVRAQNYQGWSNWSAVATARTYLGVYVSVGGVWKLAVPYVNNAGVWKAAEPHFNVTGVWK